MPDPQDNNILNESHLYPMVTLICKPDAPINADWQRIVYPLPAHALEEPVEQSANAVGSTGRYGLVEDGLEKDTSKIANHSATGSDLSIQRPDTEHGNGRQESSDTSSLADGIDTRSYLLKSWPTGNGVPRIG
jgi:hypothetical protein